MKRRYCGLAILLMALMLTACGGNTEDSHKKNTTKETNKGKNEVTTFIEKPSDLIGSHQTIPLLPNNAGPLS